MQGLGLRSALRFPLSVHPSLPLVPTHWGLLLAAAISALPRGPPRCLCALVPGVRPPAGVGMKLKLLAESDLHTLDPFHHQRGGEAWCLHPILTFVSDLENHLWVWGKGLP